MILAPVRKHILGIPSSLGCWRFGGAARGGGGEPVSVSALVVEAGLEARAGGEPSSARVVVVVKDTFIFLCSLLPLAKQA